MEEVLKKYAAEYNVPFNWWKWSYSSWENKHVTTRAFRKMIPGEEWASYFKFCFVRNPWDRVVSNFHWQKSKGRWQDSTLKDIILKTDFRQLMDQRLYVYDVFGNKIVDFVGRFENLQEDFNQVCDRIGIERQVLPHHHKSSARKLYWEYYNEETKELVAKRYAKDIGYFSYQFGVPERILLGDVQK